jgi:hypothetical protein
MKTLLLFLFMLTPVDPPKVFIAGGTGGIVVEGIKGFRKNCTTVVVTTKEDAADYTVLLSDNGAGAARKGRSAVVSSPDGSVLLATSDRALSTSMKKACESITQDWSAKHK